MKVFKGILYSSIIFISLSARANGDFGLGGTLPKGVRFLSIRYGMVNSFTDKFDSSGTLEGLDRKNIEMNAANIKKISPQNYALLESVLNSQSMTNLKPADELNLGTLNFNGEANLNYMVPILAFGINSNWTLGMAVPMVTHTSNISVSQSGYNNSAEIFRQISGNTYDLNTALGTAEFEMSQGPLFYFNRDLAKNGYKTIEPYEKRFMGDIRIASRVKLKEVGRWSVYLNQDLNLPTGPADDPDDLTDMPVFRKFFLENQLYQNFKYNKKLSFGLGAKYKLNIPDMATVRVPENANSALIPLDRKETLQRDIADEYSAQLAAIYNVTEAFLMGTGFEFGFKGKDSYWGHRGYNYEILGDSTDSSFGTFKVKAGFSTVEMFKKGFIAVPFEISYAFSDTIMGRNIERQSTHEFIGKMYF